MTAPTDSGVSPDALHAQSYFENGLTPTQAARRYISLGLAVIPIPTGKKAPTIKAWQTLVIGLDEVERYFPDGKAMNQGLRLGETRLVDVDLDAPETVALAPHFLPPTPAIFGRAAKPRSHFIYYVGDPQRTVQFRDPDGVTLVELRGDGGQTVVPPSIHPSGERVEWHSAGEPAESTWADLLIRVSWLAAAALLTRYLDGGRPP